MKRRSQNNKKVPVILIDESLNKYNDIVLFPEKLAKANEVLKRIGLPKTYKSRSNKLIAAEPKVKYGKR